MSIQCMDAIHSLHISYYLNLFREHDAWIFGNFRFILLPLVRHFPMADTLAFKANFCLFVSWKKGKNTSTSHTIRVSIIIIEYYNDSILCYHIRDRRTIHDDHIISGYFANKTHYFHYFRYRKMVGWSRNNNFNLCVFTSIWSNIKYIQSLNPQRWRKDRDKRYEIAVTVHQIHFNKWWNNESTHCLEMLSWLLLKNFKDNFPIHFVKSFRSPSVSFCTPLSLSLFSVGFIFFRHWHTTFSYAMNQQHKCGKSLQDIFICEQNNSQGTFNANGAKVRLAWLFFQHFVHGFLSKQSFCTERAEIQLFPSVSEDS